MPRIFDNIEPPPLVSALREALGSSTSADYCVGYFNLRGWQQVDDLVERWVGGSGGQCRLLIGMQPSADEEARRLLSLTATQEGIDQAQALRLKRNIAEGFKQQLTFGAPTNGDEAALRRLSQQLRSRKLVVKLHLRHTLHAKLYLHHTDNPNLPLIGFVGSSNLTLAGMARQGELNVDVLDHDACTKLQRWFDQRWQDRFCVDVSAELADIIDESWARPAPVLPYHIYLKIAFQLSQEARTGVDRFRVPAEFRSILFDFQAKAVQMAAEFVNRRDGVMIGDVVGLGKTLMAAAVARILQDDQGFETLIICPRNLVSMWEGYVHRYRLSAKVVPLSLVDRDLSALPRYRLVIIDESQNLRNREGKRYASVLEYVVRNESRCILLSATPYNKGFADLAAQLGLVVDREARLGLRPEAYIRSLGGEVEFIRRHQFAPDTLAAFELSDLGDDWRELMRRYLVRRTRSFIRKNYASRDDSNGREYLRMANGERSYFPDRVPRTVKFVADENDPDDPYGRLYSSDVVAAIDSLLLPRYGLGEYQASRPATPPTLAERQVLQDLGRAGQRLIGFCRTNLFKRLESAGPSFIESIERHILRNYVYLHALENQLQLPIGTQDAAFLDADQNDEDSDLFELDEGEGGDDLPTSAEEVSARREQEFRVRARQVYESYQRSGSRRFRWVRPALFDPRLAVALRDDSNALIALLNRFGEWDPDRDAKLAALVKLVNEDHPHEKVLIFTQFADTVRYLVAELTRRGISGVEGVTGQHADPTSVAARFSPVSNSSGSNGGTAPPIRVLVSTDVLSEGQNLQDCAIVVNFDLPWAIIRLIQRAGRVDRIGQQAERILCYTFLPADGVERIIALRSRVVNRLKQNAEVIGSDEAFFEEQVGLPVLDIYNEKAGVFDDADEGEVDISSEAFQVWHSAVEGNPSLERIIRNLPDVVYSSRSHTPTATQPEGVLLYLQTAEGNDTLAWVNLDGSIHSQSLLTCFRAAACTPDEPAVERHPQHHDAVRSAVARLIADVATPGGQLGRPSGARFKTYDRLQKYAEQVRGTAFEVAELEHTIEDIYRFPLLQSATDALNRQLRLGITDEALARMVVELRADGRLCHIRDDEETPEPRIICSLGLHAGAD